MERAGLFFGPESLAGALEPVVVVPSVVKEDLHSVLSGLLQWLAATQSMELVAYWNPRLRKSHLVTSLPLGEQESLQRMVTGLMNGPVPRIRHWRQQEWFFHLWMGAPLEAWDRLLVVEKGGQLSSEEWNSLLLEGIKKFHPVLQQVVHEQLPIPPGAGNGA